MEFRVLGSLQVIGPDAVPIDLTSTSQRRLVCLLLVRASVVSADSLADHLGVSPGALRTTVSRLRRLLGPDTLVSVPPGYELRAEAVDARIFEDRLAQAAMADDGTRARRLLEEAISMWRGDAYAEFAHEPWAMAESGRLAELRAGAVEDLAVLLLEGDKWSAAIARLEPLIATHPFRDRPRGLLMRALADSGRRVDALRAFQDYRRFLLDEVGTEPSPELAALDRAIARQDEPRVSEPTFTAGSTNDVTVLCTDFVDSVDWTSGRSPGPPVTVRRHHLSILRQAVAEAGGSQVERSGEGLMVVFDTPGSALSCAVAMQQGIDHENHVQGQAAGLRVGLSRGRVTAEDGTPFGNPVVEATRLCRAGRAGQILALDGVRGPAGRRSPHRFRSLGPLVLEGIADPVEAVEVLWESAVRPVPNEVPLPVRLGRRPAVPIVGREAELDVVAESARRVIEGQGREVLLVSGEAGLGKTTLVAEAARSAFATGACVLAAHCEEDLTSPYQLFADTIGHYVTHCAEDELRAHVEAQGSELARLVPALATRIPDLPPSKATDSDSERYLLFAAVVGLLSQASAKQPIVLVLDDLQWADAGSLELLGHLIASDQPMAVLVLGTYRDTELSHSHPLLNTLAALQRQVNVTRLELTGLSSMAVVALMESIAGYALDEAGISLAQAVYRETDGNPFFVSEVLRNLFETGAIYRDSTGRWEAIDKIEDMGLPVSVREVIGARIGRLGVAGRILSTAAVIGRDFDIDLLALAADLPEDELLDLLDHAAAAALVREGRGRPGQYTFAHALIQHTLYEELGPTRRARAHRRVGEALEQLCGTRPGTRVGELARHWFNGGQPGDWTKALEYSRQAGDAALAALAPADALRYYTQALDLYAEADHPDRVLGIDLSIGLGIAQRQTGDPCAFARRCSGPATRPWTSAIPSRLVIAALANDRGWYSAGGVLDTDKINVLETTLGRLAPDDRDRPLVLATLCSELALGTPARTSPGPGRGSVGARWGIR